jgi:hypothetical protein
MIRLRTIDNYSLDLMKVIMPTAGKEESRFLFLAKTKM